MIEQESSEKQFSIFKSAQLMQADTLDRNKEYFIGNVQTCYEENGQTILYKSCTGDAVNRNEVTYRDSGFIDDRSICSNINNIMMKPSLKQIKFQDIEANNNQIEYNKEKIIFKKNSLRFDDSGIDKDKESSSSDIDEIARFNQMELRKQALKSRKKSFNHDKNTTSMNTVPKPKSRLNNNDRQQPLDPRSLLNENTYEQSNNPLTNTESMTSDIYEISPMLNSCGLIMCSNLPTPVFTGFIPANLIPIAFKDKNNTQMFIKSITNGIMQNTEDLSSSLLNDTNQKNSKNNLIKSVTFEKSEDSGENEAKKTGKNIKKSTTFQDRTRAQLEEAALAWQRRQAIKNDSNNAIEPPIFDRLNSPPYADSNFRENESPNHSEINTDEFQFFMNAIEKLKAANLFHEDDLKKMSDEQIYEALIEHAKMQKKATYSIITETTCQSIDKEDDDLPIIMRNLHSVKSLKHYFEVKSKTSSDLNSMHSPIIVSKSARKAISCQIRSSRHKSSEKNFETQISLSTSPLSIKEEVEDSDSTSEILNAKSIDVSENASGKIYTSVITIYNF